MTVMLTKPVIEICLWSSGCLCPLNCVSQFHYRWSEANGYHIAANWLLPKGVSLHPPWSWLQQPLIRLPLWLLEGLEAGWEPRSVGWDHGSGCSVNKPLPGGEQEGYFTGQEEGERDPFAAGDTLLLGSVRGSVKLQLRCCNYGFGSSGT